MVWQPKHREKKSEMKTHKTPLSFMTSIIAYVLLGILMKDFSTFQRSTSTIRA